MMVGRVATDRNSNEIQAVRDLAGRLDPKGRIVTLDAVHIQQNTARFLPEQVPPYT